jgi:hypothetical protein
MSNDLCFVMIPKSYELPVWIYTIEYVVIFSDGTCLVEFQDPKVLIVFSDSTEVVVIGEKNQGILSSWFEKSLPRR